MEKDVYSIDLGIYNRFHDKLSLGLDDVKKALTELTQEGFLKFVETENKIKITFDNLSKVVYSGESLCLVSKKTYFLAIAKDNEFITDLKNWDDKVSQIYFLDKENKPVYHNKNDPANINLNKINSKIEYLAELHNQLLEDPSPDDLE